MESVQQVNQFEHKMVFLFILIIRYLFFPLFLVMAAVAISNVVKSSLGPVGLDKMLVDDVGVCIYNLIFLLNFYKGCNRY